MVSIDKDYMVSSKDLSLVLRDIKTAKDELTDVKKQTELAREELSVVRGLKEPYIESLKKEISELENVRDRIRSSVSSGNKLIDGLERTRIQLTENIKILTDTLKNKSMEMDSLVVLKKKEISDLESHGINLQSKNELIKPAQEKLDSISKEVESKQKELETLSTDIISTQDKLNKLDSTIIDMEMFIKSMNKKEIFLNNKLEEVDAMHERLSPKYIKIFKEFSNI